MATAPLQRGVRESVCACVRADAPRIQGNAFAVAYLRRVADLLHLLNQKSMASVASTLAEGAAAGIQKFGASHRGRRCSPRRSPRGAVQA